MLLLVKSTKAIAFTAVNSLVVEPRLALAQSRPQRGLRRLVLLLQQVLELQMVFQPPVIREKSP
jgi:hypothetical protein